MSLMRIAAGGMAVFLTAGCAYGYGASTPAMQTAVGQTILKAYQETVSTNGLSATLQEVAESGTDPIAQGNGTSTLWFATKSGETQMTVNGATNVTAMRFGDTFFEGKSAATLGNRQDLAATARQDGQSMPEVQAPGIDPFQMTTLLSAIQWPDTLVDLRPVVISNTTGQHTEYQMTVSTTKLATHLTGPDQTWLDVISREPNGQALTLDVTISSTEIATVTGQLPVETPAPRKPPAKGPNQAPPTPAPMTVTVTESFNYTKPAQRLTPPRT